jgi:hypothetical protein
MQAQPAVPRTDPFGIRTFFATRFGRTITELKLTLLDVVRSETDARSLGSLHFAYWTVLTRKHMSRLLPARDKADADMGDQMLFLSDFSGDLEVYLVGFNVVLRSALDFAWSNSVAWKNRMGLNEYLAFVEKHRLSQPYYYSPYTLSASVDDIRSATLVSEQLERFVSDVRDVDANTFANAYKQLRIVLGNALTA